VDERFIFRVARARGFRVLRLPAWMDQHAFHQWLIAPVILKPATNSMISTVVGGRANFAEDVQSLALHWR